MKLESRWIMLKLKLHCDSISERFWIEAYLKFELRSWLSSVQLKLVIAETKPVLGEEVSEKKVKLLVATETSLYVGFYYKTMLQVFFMH